MICRNEREREREIERERRERGEGGWKGGVRGSSEDFTKQAILTLCSTSMAHPHHNPNPTQPNSLNKRQRQNQLLPHLPKNKTIWFFF
jgi:hypothetical protein